jgi:hypothetical protein
LITFAGKKDFFGVAVVVMMRFWQGLGRAGPQKKSGGRSIVYIY